MTELDFPDTKVRDVRRVAMDFLARREHSCAELKRKLQAKSFMPELIDSVLEQLQKEDLLSDTRFAESYVRFRALKGFGPLKIKQELKERGVDEGLIELFVDMADERWPEAAEEARLKRFGLAVPKEASARAKQIRFLQYRGYSYEQIKSLFADE